MLRVIAGTARGHKLATPRSAARPTLDRVREAVFSILHTKLDGVRFLDLFAGSGANGIEALSRGAAYCAFVDSDAQAIDIIGKNLFHTKLTHKARSYQLTLPQSLGAIASTESPFGIVYCDPPFAGTGYAQLILQIVENQLLMPDGLLLIEHESHLQLPPSIGTLTRQRISQYGRVGITFFA
ncbi:MAG: 16S rRNA (guanine(966)-N(2))-methyltransferase RsmD [Candidatus Hydrogenedentes bacterium]|nr:16S rRNA (guanine(966)-N(2))-methyltransferase RsmD [Candidatus Hydrogenedentota bacterium]